MELKQGKNEGCFLEIRQAVPTVWIADIMR